MKHYAVSDLHGQLGLYQQIKNFISPDDVVYCLGDAGDRGPHCWETLKTILDDPQFIYIKGNHDDMLVKAVRNGRHSDDGYCLYANGGRNTFTGIVQDPRRTYYVNRLDSRPTIMSYINEQNQVVSLTHAGYSPSDEEKYRDYIWDRNHLGDEWSDESPYGGPHGIDVIVHGHTPFIYIYFDGYNVEGDFQDEKDKNLHAVWYCDHHKVCIDMGAFFTNQTVLLDLDTWEEHHFEV